MKNKRFKNTLLMLFMIFLYIVSGGMANKFGYWFILPCSIGSMIAAHFLDQLEKLEVVRVERKPFEFEDETLEEFVNRTAEELKDEK